MPIKANKVLSIAAAMGTLLLPVVHAESGLDVSGSLAVALLKYNAADSSSYVSPDTAWEGNISFNGYSDVLTPIGPVKVEAVMDLSSTINTQLLSFEEVYIKMTSPSYGSLTVGMDEGVADHVHEVDHPVIGPSSWLLPTPGTASGVADDGYGRTYLALTTANDSLISPDDSSVIKYMSPKFNGFHAGVSHTKCNTTNALTNVFKAGHTLDTPATCNGSKNINEFLLGYEKSIEGADVKFNVAMTSATGYGVDTANSTEYLDTNSFNAGLKVGYKQAHLGLGIGSIEGAEKAASVSGSQVKTKVGNASLRYDLTDTLSIGAAYYSISDDASYKVGSANNENDYSPKTTGYEFALSKALSKDFIVGAVHQRTSFESKMVKTLNNDATFVYLGMSF